MNMKKSILSLLLLGSLISLSGCNNSTIPTYEDFDDNYVDTLPTNSEDGLTLHAFCWSYNQIRDQLVAIKDAGFKSILTMPVQTPKGGGAAWWAFYQPLSFSVAESSSLGTKEELRLLCLEAEELDISIYSDIIFNHMANIGDDEYESDGTPKVSPKVADYEPYIYKHRNDEGESATFHHNKFATGSGAETQFYQYGALPDLNTANPYIQERALSLLKECIDLGIDGFRFDAAKHIETPDDPQYPSNFWPNVLNPAKEYYLEVNDNKDNLYLYGEILGNPSGRDISVYTEYMDVTDDQYSKTLSNGAIYSRSADILVNSGYSKNVPSNNIMTWVESHDSYTSSGGAFTDIRVAKMWGVIASRKDLQGLYLARPNEATEVGKIATYQFESEYVAVANRFHNRFIGAEEYLHSEADDTVFVNERYSETDQGAFVLNLKNESMQYVDKVTFEHLEDGNYYDTVTGKKVVVHKGEATIEFDISGICVLVKTKTSPRPTYTISSRGGSFVGSLDLFITATNAEKSYYYFNDDVSSKVEFASRANLTIGNNVINGKEKLTLVLENQGVTVTRHFTFEEVTLIEGYFNVINLNTTYYTDYELYIWSWAPVAGTTDYISLWHQNYIIQERVLLIDVTSIEGFLLATFPKGYEVTDLYKWDSNVVKQSGDIKGEMFDLGFYDASGF